MKKILWEGREKVLRCWLSQFSKIERRQSTGQLFSLPFQRNFPISFKPKVANDCKDHWENAKKVSYYEKCVRRHASFPPRRSVNKIIKIFYKSLLLLKYFVRHEVVIVQWCSVTSLECFLWLLRIHFTRKSGKVLLCLQYWLGAQVSQWGQRHGNFYYYNAMYGLCNFTTLNYEDIA